MGMTQAEARLWLEGFEAADRADRNAKRREGPRTERSVALFLSVLAAARLAAHGRPLADPRRAEQDEAVRATWERLRSRLVR